MDQNINISTNVTENAGLNIDNTPDYAEAVYTWRVCIIFKEGKRANHISTYISHKNKYSNNNS